jgi:DDE family transposase
MNWRGRPLTSHQVVVNSIAATRTRAGLRVAAELDTARYPVGNSISRDQLAALPIRPHAHRGAWNYTIEPASAPSATRPDHGNRERARAQALAMLADPG